MRTVEHDAYMARSDIVSKRRSSPENIYYTLSKWPPNYNTSQGTLTLGPYYSIGPTTVSIKCKPFTGTEKAKWISQAVDHGFVRLYDPEALLASSLVVPCTLDTTCIQVASKLGIDPNDFHVQFNGHTLRRLLADDRLLAIQNKFLTSIGITNVRRQQFEGDKIDLGYLIRFYAGRPSQLGGYSRAPLSCHCLVRKRGPFRKWSRRYCVLSQNRLFIFGDNGKKGSDELDTVHLDKGKARIAISNSQGKCLKLASSPEHPPQVFYSLAFTSEVCENSILLDDYSDMQMETIPDELFRGDNPKKLSKLNLHGNSLRERPPKAGQYNAGWLNDLVCFQYLTALNLSDNDLLRCPTSLFQLESLSELSLANNKITDLPPAVAKLKNLSVLNLQNNCLHVLPMELSVCEHLVFLDLSFNRFDTIPAVLNSLSRLDSWILNGNHIINFSSNVMLGMPMELRKVELRHNEISLCAANAPALNTLCFLTHLDIRDNNRIIELDLSTLSSLQVRGKVLPLLMMPITRQVLNCERCSIITLRVNGSCLSELRANKNKIRNLFIRPTPHQIAILELSHNCMESLPEWTTELVQIKRILCSHNYIEALPDRLLTNVNSLNYLDLSHNHIRALPTYMENCAIETLLLHHNHIQKLPEEFLSSAHRLYILNLSHNRLAQLPSPSEVSELNKIKELCLASNQLTNSALDVIARYRHLQVLDISYNRITSISNEFFQKLQMLQEINISGNQIPTLPSTLTSLPLLTTLRAHSNVISSLPNLATCEQLLASHIDLAANRITDVPISRLMAPKVKYIDVACNDAIAVQDIHQLKALRDEKSVSVVDINNEIFLPEENWKLGTSQFFDPSSAKPSVLQLKGRPGNSSADGILLGILESLFSYESGELLQQMLPEIVEQEKREMTTRDQYLKYSLIMAHHALKENGQRQGVSCALCHLVPRYHRGASRKYCIRVANCGDVEVVLCRNGEPILLTKRFTAESSEEEYARIRLSGGTVDQNNAINGTVRCSRLIGCSFLYPSVVPIPYEFVWNLADCDEFLVLANGAVWQTMSYQEVVAQVRSIPEPSLAAKYLQDIVRAYRCTEDISIMVIRFGFPKKGADFINMFTATPYRERRFASKVPVNSESNSSGSPDYEDPRLALPKPIRMFGNTDYTSEDSTDFRFAKSAYSVIRKKKQEKRESSTNGIHFAKPVRTVSHHYVSKPQVQASTPVQTYQSLQRRRYYGDDENRQRKDLAKRLAHKACQARQSLRSVTNAFGRKPKGKQTNHYKCISIVPKSENDSDLLETDEEERKWKFEKKTERYKSYLYKSSQPFAD
ncbi:LRR 8 and LRR 1 and PP2C and LRR 7 domain contain ing protein [Trichuris trichiura]|uniref:LRR 8 and LRR 1 and PP2C and LRR 7 domain contain ing protein n=1 Tax=Trichuris trichiura TaxID=36087 RepID=A0A077Z151_TRITR|nr:LRR 8 and LRR 1 and PP2C and LRR 7 domain contain ing protein [Trichuris trichiura]